MNEPSPAPHESDWALRLKPRGWQEKALALWTEHWHGVVSVVTGGGKTVFAFQCMLCFREEFPDARFIIIVPTITLLDQWTVAAQEELGVKDSEISCYSSQEKSKKPNIVNILVINSARTLAAMLAKGHPAMLIVDECHRAGSPENAKALMGDYRATLGLSATPHREYDEGFTQLIQPALGEVSLLRVPMIIEQHDEPAEETESISPNAS
jgi:superfamily II DNA or RNA helicase